MSMFGGGTGGNNLGGGASLADLVTIGNNLIAKLSALNTTIGNILPRVTGTFTMANATTTAVTQPSTKANSVIQWTPTNGAAATLILAKGVYLASQTVGTGFTLSTASGTAAGTETFQYSLFNPS